MPWSTTETVTYEEGLDEDGNGKGHICCDGTDGENGPNGNRPSEDQEKQTDSDTCVEPYGVDRGEGVRIDTLDPEGCWEAIVAGV